MDVSTLKMMENSDILICGHCSRSMGTLKYIISRELCMYHICFLKYDNITIDFEKKSVFGQSRSDNITSKVDPLFADHQTQPVAGPSHYTKPSTKPYCFPSKEKISSSLNTSVSLQEESFNTENSPKISSPSHFQNTKPSTKPYCFPNKESISSSLNTSVSLEAESFNTKNSPKIWSPSHLQYAKPYSSPSKQNTTSSLNASVSLQTKSINNENSSEIATNWTDESVQLLINLYVKHKDKFDSPLYNKKKVWFLIAQEMGEYGIIKTGNRCDEKWRNLKKMYEKVLQEKKKTGNGPVNWKYFQDFHDIYFNDPKFQPLLTVSSDGSIRKRGDLDVTENNNLVDLGTSGDMCNSASSKFSPEEKKRKAVSALELDKRKQKRHEERIALKKEMFEWFKNNFKRKHMEDPDEN